MVGYYIRVPRTKGLNTESLATLTPQHGYYGSRIAYFDDTARNEFQITFLHRGVSFENIISIGT